LIAGAGSHFPELDPQSRSPKDFESTPPPLSGRGVGVAPDSISKKKKENPTEKTFFSSKDREENNYFFYSPR
jgi:hypothetical protein